MRGSNSELVQERKKGKKASSSIRQNNPEEMAPLSDTKDASILFGSTTVNRFNAIFGSSYNGIPMEAKTFFSYGLSTGQWSGDNKGLFT